MGGRGQGGCIRIFEVIVKMQKKRFGVLSGGGGPVRGLGGQSGCERRIEIIVKMPKKRSERGGSGSGHVGKSGWM